MLAEGFASGNGVLLICCYAAVIVCMRMRTWDGNSLLRTPLQGFLLSPPETQAFGLGYDSYVLRTYIAVLTQMHETGFERAFEMDWRTLGNDRASGYIHFGT